jgi:hypothetical protein
MAKFIIVDEDDMSYIIEKASPQTALEYFLENMYEAEQGEIFQIVDLRFANSYKYEMSLKKIEKEGTECAK